MAQFDGVLESPGFGKALETLLAFAQNDARLRALQSLNAPHAQYFEQGTITSTTVTPSYPIGKAAYAAPYLLTEAQSGTQEFSFLVFLCDGSSGSGRYMITGDTPTPTIGFPIPTAGVILVIEGNENIRTFRAIGEAGQTLNYTRCLFR